MKPRAGFALAFALLALVLIAVLASGALFAGNQETHATEAEVLDQQAASFAERAANVTIGVWACPECDAMQVGSVIYRNPDPSPPLESTVYITRLDSTLFLITGEGRIMSAGAARIRRRISVAVIATRDSLGVARAAPITGESWAAAYQM